MKVYHGSLDAVINPVIKEPTRTLDYGSGFYVTTSVKQAERWVLRKLDASHPVGWVNVYEWDERKTDGLQIQNFGVPDEKWLDFVMSLKSATKPLNVLIAFTRPLITEFADNLNLKHPLLPTISPYPTTCLHAIHNIIPISCRHYPKSVWKTSA